MLGRLPEEEGLSPMTSLAMLQQQLHLVLIKLASHYTRWQSGHSWCCHLQVKENTFEFQEIQKTSNEKEMDTQIVW